MSWFKVDDKLWGHPKWLALPPRARGLWVTAGSWCAANETGGEVPRHVVRALSGTRPDVVALVQVGLWEETDEGWTFHDWDQFQPDAASQKAKREAESQGGDLGNHRRWHVKRGIRVVGCVHCQPSGTRSAPDRGADSPPNPPVPTRPDPIEEDASRLPPADADDAPRKTRRKPERPLPDDWAPNAKHFAQAETRGVDLTAQARAFRNHAATHDRRARDWDAAFRTWLDKATPAPGARPAAARATARGGHPGDQLAW